MILNKIVIDRFAAAKSFFESVPKTDLILTQFPAKTDRLPLIAREKIDQSDVDVLDQGASLLHPIGRVFQGSGAGIAAGTKSQMRSGIDPRSSCHADALSIILDVLVSFLILGFIEENVA